MIVASIYGFVDYKKTSQTKEFTSMYLDEKQSEPATVEAEKPENARLAVVSKKEQPVKATKKKAGTKKPVTIDELESVKEPAVPVELDITKVNEVSEIEEPPAEILAEEPVVVKEIKKKKKLNHKIFSRAAIRDDVEIVEKKKTSKSKESVSKQ